MLFLLWINVIDERLARREKRNSGREELPPALTFFLRMNKSTLYSEYFHHIFTKSNHIRRYFEAPVVTNALYRCALPSAGHAPEQHLTPVVYQEFIKYVASFWSIAYSSSSSWVWDVTLCLTNDSEFFITLASWIYLSQWQTCIENSAIPSNRIFVHFNQDLTRE